MIDFIRSIYLRRAAARVACFCWKGEASGSCWLRDELATQCQQPPSDLVVSFPSDPDMTEGDAKFRIVDGFKLDGCDDRLGVQAQEVFKRTSADGSEHFEVIGRLDHAEQRKPGILRFSLQLTMQSFQSPPVALHGEPRARKNSAFIGIHGLGPWGAS